MSQDAGCQVGPCLHIGYDNRVCASSLQLGCMPRVQSTRKDGHLHQARMPQLVVPDSPTFSDMQAPTLANHACLLILQRGQHRACLEQQAQMSGDLLLPELACGVKPALHAWHTLGQTSRRASTVRMARALAEKVTASALGST